MKKFNAHLFKVLVCLGLIFVPQLGKSQLDTLTLGTGTSISGTFDTDITPFGSYYHDGKNQLLYTATELTAAGFSSGLIMGVAFEVDYAAGQTLTGFNVKVKHTSVTATTGWETGFTTVYSQDYLPTTGWNYIYFDTPYAWDGVSNVLVDICFNNGNYTDNNTVYYTATTNSSNAYGYSDSSVPDPCADEAYDGSTVNRPNTRFVIFTPFTNDAGIAQLDSPYVPSCTLGNNVWATLVNYGTSTLTSATINWELNGAAQTPFAWTGSLAPLASQSVMIGTAAMAAGDTLTVWPVDPNGSPEPVGAQWNDTVGLSLFAGLSGVKFITPLSLPNVYNSFTDAVNDLIQYGVCGPVEFHVDAGVYNEQISIPEIVNASAVNTIVFKAASGISGPAELTYTPTGTSDNYTVDLNGADYITFKDLQVSTGAVSSYEGRVFWIHGSANHNTIDSCTIIGDPSTFSTWTSECALIGSDADVDSNNVFTNNIMSGGSFAFHLRGAGSTGLEPNTVISNNTVTDFYYQGLLLEYLDGISVTNNQMEAQAGGVTWSSQWNVGDCKHLSMSHNTFLCDHDGYGLRLGSVSGLTTDPSYIYNNSISVGSTTGDSRGMEIFNSNNTVIHSNSVYVNSLTTEGMYLSGGFNTDFLNNNIYVNGGAPVWYLDGGFNESDYNNLYGSGDIANTSTGTLPGMVDLQNFTGNEVHSISVDPVYQSFTDLRTCNDTLNDVGVGSAMVADDHAGIGRSGLVDIGAFEFDGVNSFSLGADTNICPGSTLTIGNPNSTSTWLWNTGPSTNTLDVTAAGAYIAQITNNCGVGSATINVGIDQPTSASFTFVPYYTGMIFTSTSTNATTFHWDFGNGDTSNLENPYYVYTVEGTYTVTLTVTGPCGTDTFTGTVHPNAVGIDEQSFVFDILPNPASDYVTLQSSEVFNNAQIEVIDATGRVVHQETATNSVFRIDVQRFESGTYFIRVTSDTKMGIQKLIVR